MPFLAIKIKAKPLGCNNRVYWAQKGWMGDLSVWRLLCWWQVAGGPPSKCQRVANNQILSKFKTTTSVTICICYTRVVIVCYSFVSACIFFKDTVFEIKFNQIVSFGGIFSEWSRVWEFGKEIQFQKCFYNIPSRHWEQMSGLDIATGCCTDYSVSDPNLCAIVTESKLRGG